MILLVVLPGSTRAQAPNTSQEVVNYFLGIFKDDWSYGSSYDSGTDGMGYAQSYTISGSPSFTPYKQAKQDISANMTVMPILSPDTSENGIINLINSASSTLYIEQLYIFDDVNDIVLAIIAAKNRGVSVKIILDDGSLSTYYVSATVLVQHGIPVRALKSNATLCIPFSSLHNKGIIVDGTKVLISSINWSPQSLGTNREAGIIVASTDVATYYTTLFNFDWDRSPDFVPSSSYSDPSPSGNSHSFTPTTFSGKMDVTCLASPDNCFDVVNSILRGATKSIYISVYTLSNPYLIDTLYARIGAGVDVRLLLEKNQVGASERNYNRWTMENLTEIGNNGHVAKGLWSWYHYQHCKYAIIDNATLIISSGNWGMDSCPPAQSDGDVSGNRDWWFAVYGNGIPASSGGDTKPGDDSMPGYVVVFLVLASIGTVACITVRRFFFGSHRNVSEKIDAA